MFIKQACLLPTYITRLLLWQEAQAHKKATVCAGGTSREKKKPVSLHLHILLPGSLAAFTRCARLHQHAHCLLPPRAACSAAWRRSKQAGRTGERAYRGTNSFCRHTTHAASRAPATLAPAISAPAATAPRSPLQTHLHISLRISHRRAARPQQAARLCLSCLHAANNTI